MPDASSTPPATSAVVPDQRLAGRYRLSRRLARGGMAEVWEATDEVLARPVAIKVLLPHLAADEAVVARFRREAVAAARLSHPHIVSIFDTCSDAGVEAIVMELVRGVTLRQALDEHGALGARRATAIAAQVADALATAHRHGLVHRDVKPGNILLADDGRVMVADFGIAKAAEAAGDLTEVGQVVGTAKYLSPEQVRGEAVDARSDVYALGVVLYEMLCGRPPFDADNATATALARLTSQPLRPRQVRPGIPRDLEDVVLTAMALDADDRYPSASELRAALEAADLHGAEEVDATTAAAIADPTRTVAVDERAEPAEVPGFAQSERRWLVPAVLLVVVAASLGLVGVLLGQTEVGRDIFDAVGRAGRPGAGGNEPVAVASAHAFDPQGTGGENDDDADAAIDGDPATAWTTEHYRSADLGGLKDGVGLVLVLEQPRALDRLEVVSPTVGWTAQVFTASAPAADLAGWGSPVATLSDGAPADLGGREAGAVLVWITDLGEPGGGSSSRPFSLALAEVALRG